MVHLKPLTLESEDVCKANDTVQQICIDLGSVWRLPVAAPRSAAHAADAEAVTIDTTFVVKTPPVRLDRPARRARASVVLMTGGNGLLNIDATGTITDSTGNFLIRSADLFLRHGLNVMMADAAPAHPTGLNFVTRLSATHAAELQGFINAAISRWASRCGWWAPAMAAFQP